jgi:hypothetical protein
MVGDRPLLVAPEDDGRSRLLLGGEHGQGAQVRFVRSLGSSDLS